MKLFVLLLCALNHLSMCQEHTSTLLLQPRAHPPAVVKDRPFEASFESTFSDGSNTKKRIVQGSMFRDIKGRTRLEYTESAGEHATIISDPVRGELLVVDDVGRTAQRIPMAETHHQDGWAFANCIPAYTNQDKSIQGLHCRKVVLKDSVTREDVGEVWLSDERFIVLRDVSIVNGATRDWHVTHLEFKEPAAILFTIPSGYQVVLDEGR
jgi:hypothetical protein